MGFVKIGVDAVVCEEGVVGSVFGDAAVVEDDDAVAEFERTAIARALYKDAPFVILRVSQSAVYRRRP